MFPGLRMADQQLSTAFLTPDLTFSKRQLVHSLSHYSYGSQVAAHFLCNDLSPPMLYRFSWVKFSSLRYQVNKSVLLCPLRGSVSAQFGVLSDIFLYDSKILFVCQMYRTLGFHKHYQSYKVRLSRHLLASN